MENPRIVRIEWGRLEGKRPRKAGCNARLGEHGSLVRLPIARILTEDGTSGFGYAALTRERAEVLLGNRLDDLFSQGSGATEAGLPLEYPLWDLVAKRAGVPVYALAAAATGATPAVPLRAPCYDTSLYFDDLHLRTDEEAAALLAGEARDGYERGHRAFKIKIGRGARHMPLEEGTRRDIAVVRAVRAAIGSDLPIMVDANDGYHLNLAKRFLAETADCTIFWLEEAFHEDAVLYRDLRTWMEAQGLKVLIADGEGAASPGLMDWAREHVIDVVQRDIVYYGFTRWLALGQQLDEWSSRSAPHHYGTCYGNYGSCHLAPTIRGFTFVEWDQATIPGLETPGYAIEEGRVTVPDASGFGLVLEDAIFRRAVESTGFVLSC